MTTYPTDEAWNYFTHNLDDIRAVVGRFLPVPEMQIPNTRVAITDSAGIETVTDRRAAIPLPILNVIEDFDNAVAIRDTNKLMEIMNDAWLRAPESRSVYNIPGFSEMCGLLDCTIDGFFDPEGEGVVSCNTA